MTILNDRQIKELVANNNMISPFCAEKVEALYSYGLDGYGYTMRIKDTYYVPRVEYGVINAKRLALLGIESHEKSADKFGSIFYLIFGSGPLAFTFFQFNAGADKLMHLVWGDKMTFSKLSIDVIAWISIPNVAYGF